ncbi:MAG TPA: translation initiation factor IF-2 associated domain-containing protein, partial [Xanthobacteraceae bacterium]
MTETKHPGEKLTVAPTKATLSLKRPGVEQGVVKQSFSHGRTKAVVVEKVKSRRGDARPEPAPAAAPAAAPASAAPVRRTLTAARPTAA